MRADPAPAENWRNAAAYAPLVDADCSLFAWEWLRRDPDYRLAALDAARSTGDAHVEGPSAMRFGLVAFEPPGRAVPDARPLWTARAHPPVLHVGRARGRALGGPVRRQPDG